MVYWDMQFSIYTSYGEKEIEWHESIQGMLKIHIYSLLLFYYWLSYSEPFPSTFLSCIIPFFHLFVQTIFETWNNDPNLSMRLHKINIETSLKLVHV